MFLLGAEGPWLWPRWCSSCIRRPNRQKDGSVRSIGITLDRNHGKELRILPVLGHLALRFTLLRCVWIQGSVSQGAGMFIKFDKIRLISALAALPKAVFLDREGQPEGGVCVQNRIEDVSGRVGNSDFRFGDDEGVERGGVVLHWQSGLRGMLRVGNVVGVGLGFPVDDSIAWVAGLRLFTERLSGVDFGFDGRGRGLRLG